MPGTALRVPGTWLSLQEVLFEFKAFVHCCKYRHVLVHVLRWRGTQKHDDRAIACLCGD